MANVIIRDLGSETRVSVRKNSDGTVSISLFEQTRGRLPTVTSAILTAEQATSLGITAPLEY
jgi:hypothetical protein